MTPSVYIDIIFIFLLYYLFEEGYWRGLFKELILKIKNNYQIFILVLTCVYFSILFIDLPVTQYLSRQNNTKFLNYFIKSVNNLGNGKLLFSLLTISLIIALLFKKNNYRKIISISLAASVYAGLINLVLKILVNRARPYVSSNPYDFFNYFNIYKYTQIFKVDYLSMPSGHTIVIFAAITPLIIYCKSRLCKILWVILPTLVAFARVYLFRHWLSDVIMASFLGTMVGLVSYEINISKKAT